MAKPSRKRRRAAREAQAAHAIRIVERLEPFRDPHTKAEYGPVVKDDFHGRAYAYRRIMTRRGDHVLILGWRLADEASLPRPHVRVTPIAPHERTALRAHAAILRDQPLADINFW